MSNNKSLTNVSKLKLIYPVRLRNVIVKLDNQEKTIDVLICFKERRRRLAGRFVHQSAQRTSDNSPAVQPPPHAGCGVPRLLGRKRRESSLLSASL